MGVDFYPCDKCGETFPDCGEYDHCEKGHRLCSDCMPDVPHEWDVDEDDENRDAILARRTSDGELTCAECPVCKGGGTETERLSAENARLRDALRKLEHAGRFVPVVGNDSGHVDVVRFKAALDTATAVLTDTTPTAAPAGDGWVRCDERMPGHRALVLVYYHGDVLIAHCIHYDTGAILLEADNGACFGEHGGAHWRPLPPPPTDTAGTQQGERD